MATVAEEEDPFDVFGDDSSDDEDGDAEIEEDTEARRIARSLLQSSNDRATTIRSSAPTTTDNDDFQQQINETTEEENEDVSNNNWEDEVELPWSSSSSSTDPPLYVGPMKIVAALPFGGGRGCVAARNLPPGTLLLVEEPLVSWSVKDNTLDLNTLQMILELPKASQIVIDLEFFYPTKQTVDDDDDDESNNGSDPEQVNKMMRSLRSQYCQDPQLALLVELAKERGVVNSDGTFLCETDVLRMLLALRYNGLESGIFRYAAMLNHADQPNCVKFMAATTKEQQQSSSSTSYSEVRTTRPVRRGEPLTISYTPRILSHASRRKHLWEQHRFDIGDVQQLSSTLREMELIGKQVPPSALNRWDENSTTSRIEMAIAELQEMYNAANEATTTTDDDYATLSEQAKALEQASLELCVEAETQLKNEKHVLLIPCLKLHMDCCDLVQQQRNPQLLLSASDRIKLLGRVVVTARRLLKLQTLFYGPDHFELATTSFDLAQAISFLLSRSPKHLLSLQQQRDDEELSTISSWSVLDHQLRKDYDRIKRLYPRDADKWIADSKEEKEII